MKLTVEAADFAQPELAEKFREWVFNTPENLFDQKVMFYPTTNTLVVKKDDEPELFGPFQATITLESLAVRPGLTPMETARALKQFMEAIKAIARHTGVREINFICKDASLVEFLEGREFELVKHPVLRIRVPGPDLPPVTAAAATSSPENPPA